MRDDQKFEIERAFDLLPHVVGCSWASIWFRFNGIKHPKREEFRDKVIEYFEMLSPVFESYFGEEKFDEIDKYIKTRKKEEIEKITNGLNKEVEKRYDRYIDYG
ncbi:MAG: hypothetical protein ACE5R3_03580 [Nitrosopumilaceae archaeon]